MFRTFHGRPTRRVAAFHSDLVIPAEVVLAGEAKQVLYRSDKLNPSTGEDEGWIDYFHDHARGVNLYRCDRSAEGEVRAVPAWLQNVRELTWLGYCMGFTIQGERGEERVRATKPLPELFCTPSGKALLIIQSKRTLLAMAWGGLLSVEDRGIVH